MNSSCQCWKLALLRWKVMENVISAVDASANLNSIKLTSLEIVFRCHEADRDEVKLYLVLKWYRQGENMTFSYKYCSLAILFVLSDMCVSFVTYTPMDDGVLYVVHFVHFISFLFIRCSFASYILDMMVGGDVSL